MPPANSTHLHCRSSAWALILPGFQRPSPSYRRAAAMRRRPPTRQRPPRHRSRRPRATPLRRGMRLQALRSLRLVRTHRLAQGQPPVPVPQRPILSTSPVLALRTLPDGPSFFGFPDDFSGTVTFSTSTSSLSLLLLQRRPHAPIPGHSRRRVARLGATPSARSAFFVWSPSDTKAAARRPPRGL
jgi:hypothetical protein